MSTVIRVKRSLDDDPIEAIVINCKRSKLDLDDEQNKDQQLTTVFKLGNTIKTQEDTLKHIKLSNESSEAENYKSHIVNLTEKIRKDVLSSSKNNRYKVVNYFRSKGTDSCSDIQEHKDDVTIVDVEEDPVTKKSTDVNTSFVYDLYYTNSDDFGEANLDDLINIYPLSDELVYGTSRDNGRIDTDDDDSDDSNDENNWRNDYPDESDMESVTEDDMVKAVKRFTIEDDLSSDDGEEGFVYSIDSEAAGFEEDIDPSDVRRYGEMYARFKARHKKDDDKDIDRDLYYGDIDEDEYYY